MDVPTLFSQASFGRLGDQTDRSQKHKGSDLSSHKAAPWLHRAGFSMVQAPAKGHVLGQKRDASPRAAAAALLCLLPAQEVACT